MNYTQAELETAINEERKKWVLEDLHRILLKAKDLPRYEVDQLIKDTLDTDDEAYGAENTALEAEGTN